MKRHFVFLLCSILVLGLCGCSEDVQTSTSPTEGLVEFPKRPSMGLEYTVNEDGETCTITGMGECTDTVLVIGEMQDGYRVTDIGESAFYGCTALTAVSLPDSLLTVGAYAFFECTGVKHMELGDQLVSIGKYGFADCSFSTIHIPASLEQVGEWAFFTCASLKAVHITDLERWCNIRFEGAYANPLIYAGELYLDNQLVTQVHIPDSLTAIGAWAFSGCTSITEVTIHETVESIGQRAFMDCKNLRSIHYAGTMDQWSQVGKGSNWNFHLSEYRIICADGELKK